MSKKNFKVGEYVVKKGRSKPAVMLVTRVDNSDGTFQAVYTSGGGSEGWQRYSEYEYAQGAGVQVISIQRGKSNAPVKPQVGVRKLRKAREALAKLQEFEKYL